MGHVETVDSSMLRSPGGSIGCRRVLARRILAAAPGGGFDAAGGRG